MSSRFKAAKAGKYRLVKSVHGAAAHGMWDTFVVKKGLKAPTDEINQS